MFYTRKRVRRFARKKRMQEKMQAASWAEVGQGQVTSGLRVTRSERQESVQQYDMPTTVNLDKA